MAQALDGVRVLDFTQLLQGPYATQMLGDLGADVIKVERTGKGDIHRSMTFLNRWASEGESPCFLAWNRNKRSLALDLKTSAAHEVITRLARKADVLVENFRPGVMDRLGFGYEALREINPQLIYCSATGWGSDGPYVDRPGQDLLVQGMGGAMWASGRADDPPIPLGTALCDQLGAMHIVYGVLAALYHRQRGGGGQRIEVNLLSSLIAFQMQDFFVLHNLGQGFPRPASGIGHPGFGAPFGVYRTADGFISVAMNPWSKFVSVLEAADLMKYDDPQVLFDRRDEIFEKIESIISCKSTQHWLNVMLEADLWVAPVKRLEEVADDEQVRHLNMFVEVEHPRAGRLKVTNIPIHFSSTPGRVRRPPPLVGQHTRELLAEYGFTEEQIRDMFASGAVTTDTDEVQT